MNPGRYIVRGLHLASWVLALYLFANGQFWGGVGCAVVSALMFLVSGLMLVLIWQTEDFKTSVEEARESARKAAYEDELKKRRVS